MKGLHRIGSLQGAGAVAGSAVQRSISKKAIGGVLVVLSDPSVADKLQLTMDGRLGAAGEVQIIPGMSLVPLMERADVQGGHSWSTVASLVALADDTTPEPEVMNVCSAFINVGSIRLTGMDELHSELRAVTAFSAGEWAEAYYVDSGDMPERILRLVEKSSESPIFDDPREIFIYRLGSSTGGDKPFAALTDSQLSVQVDAGDRTYGVGGRAYWALTAALGNVEAQPTRRLAMIYDDTRRERVGQSVALNLAGTERANFSTFAVVEVNEARRVVESTVDLVDEQIRQVRDLQTRDPELARVEAIKGTIIPAPRLEVMRGQLLGRGSIPAGTPGINDGRINARTLLRPR